MVTFVRILGHVLGRLPFAVQNALGGLIGFAMRLLMGRRRSIVRHNLSKAFPHLNQRELDGLVAGHFNHLGMLIVEMMTLPAMANESIRRRKIVYKGFERIDQALSDGKSAMVLTAHLGNWELMTTIAALGYEFSALYKAQKNVFDKVLQSLRTSCGLKVFTNKDGLRALVKAAARGELIGVLADQGRGPELPFFGHPARFPTGAAAFHVRHGVIAFPVFGIRDGGGRLVVTVHPPVEAPADKDRKESEIVFMKRYIEVLERQIKKHPAQYYWIHDVWRDFKEQPRASVDRGDSKGTVPSETAHPRQRPTPKGAAP